jgi:hypothetical protein
LELEELADHFTLYPDETRLLRNKSGATRLGFSLSLKFLLWKARFPRGRGELPDNVIEFVAGQVGVPAADIGFYDWDGRQVKRHRAEIRRVTGFRECSVADAENLTAWLAAHVCCREQRADRVREELLGQCRAEKIEPPAGTRIGRIIGSALQRADDTLTARISGGDDALLCGGRNAMFDIDTDPEYTDVKSLVESVRAGCLAGMPLEARHGHF